MNIEKKNNYIFISEIDDFSEAAAACAGYNNQEVSAVVFSTEKEFSLSDDQKKLIEKIPMITAVNIKNISSVSLDSLMAFDLRFSENIFTLNQDNAGNADREKFAVLFGKSRSADLCSADGTELEYVSVNSESCDEYFERIFKDKTSVQISAITECLTAVRTGDTEKGFEKESSNFFNLIKEKTKE